MKLTGSLLSVFGHSVICTEYTQSLLSLPEIHNYQAIFHPHPLHSSPHGSNGSKVSSPCYCPCCVFLHSLYNPWSYPGSSFEATKIVACEIHTGPSICTRDSVSANIPCIVATWQPETFIRSLMVLLPSSLEVKGCHRSAF